MKTLLIILCSIASLMASAQTLPDTIKNKPVTITLKAKHHALIVALMPNRGTAEAINYINQVREAQGSRSKYDTSLQVSATVTYQMVADMYYQIGSQPERLVSYDNKAVLDALVPQLYNPVYIDLLQQIMGIKEKNSTETELIRSAGQNFIMSILL